MADRPDLDAAAAFVRDMVQAEERYRAMSTFDLERYQWAFAVDLVKAEKCVPKGRSMVALCEGRLEIIARLLAQRRETGL